VPDPFVLLWQINMFKQTCNVISTFFSTISNVEITLLWCWVQQPKHQFIGPDRPHLYLYSLLCVRNIIQIPLTFNEKRITYYNNFVVGKSIQKRMITKITKTDDTIDSDVDQKLIMLDMKLGIDKPNDSGWRKLFCEITWKWFHCNHFWNAFVLPNTWLLLNIILQYLSIMDFIRGQLCYIWTC
jgi:hypothetical protein